MGMNHPQLNQMMTARMNQGGPMNVGPNVVQQGMQGMPTNMPPNQVGPMHPNNVVGGPQGGQQVGVAGMQQNAAQPGKVAIYLNNLLNIQYFLLMIIFRKSQSNA